MSEYDDEVQLFVTDICLITCAQAKPARHAAHNLDSQPFVSVWQCSAGNTHSVAGVNILYVGWQEPCQPIGG